MLPSSQVRSSLTDDEVKSGFFLSTPQASPVLLSRPVLLHHRSSHFLSDIFLHRKPYSRCQVKHYHSLKPLSPCQQKRTWRKKHKFEDYIKRRLYALPQLNLPSVIVAVVLRVAVCLADWLHQHARTSAVFAAGTGGLSARSGEKETTGLLDYCQRTKGNEGRHTHTHQHRWGIANMTILY